MCHAERLIVPPVGRAQGLGSLLRLPSGTVKDRQVLYSEANRRAPQQGPKHEGIYVPGPWFRIRKDTELT